MGKPKGSGLKEKGRDEENYDEDEEEEQEVGDQSCKILISEK